jgi:hypothetical protein
MERRGADKGSVFMAAIAAAIKRSATSLCDYDSSTMAVDAHGSASFMARVGSALVCRRLDSFSAWVSCKSLLPALLCDFSE